MHRVCGVAGQVGECPQSPRPTSPNDLHLSSLCGHVLSCAFVSAMSVHSAVSVSLCAHE